MKACIEIATLRCKRRFNIARNKSRPGGRSRRLGTGGGYSGWRSLVGKAVAMQRATIMPVDYCIR